MPLCPFVERLTLEEVASWNSQLFTNWSGLLGAAVEVFGLTSGYPAALDHHSRLRDSNKPNEKVDNIRQTCFEDN